jgi:hypothetical protein
VSTTVTASTAKGATASTIAPLRIGILMLDTRFLQERLSKA